MLTPKMDLSIKKCVLNNQLCNHLLDQSQFSECYHMFLNHFLLVDQKSFFHHLQHCNLLFLLLEKKYSVCLVRCALSSNDKTKGLFTP